MTNPFIVEQVDPQANPFVTQPSVEINEHSVPQGAFNALMDRFVARPYKKAITTLILGGEIGADFLGALVDATVDIAGDVAAISRLGAISGGGGGLGISGQDPILTGKPTPEQQARAQLTAEEVAEIEERAMRGIAFVGAASLDVGLQTVKIAARPVLAQLARGFASGGLYGALTVEDGESMVDAIAKDAALFGGANLGFGLLFGGQAFRNALPETARLVPGAEATLSRTMRELTDDVLRLPVNTEARAATIEQLREIPEVLGGTLTQLRQLEKARTAAAATELQRIQAFLADGTPVEVAIAKGKVVGDRTYRVVMEGFEGQGKSVQEALDAAAQASGAHQRAAVNATVKALRDEVGETVGFGASGVPEAFQGRLTVVSNPRDIGVYGKFLAPIHTWGKHWPAARAIYENARQRSLVQEQVVAEWRDLIERTRQGLSKNDRIELGQLLDSHVRGEDLPTSTPRHLATWFGEWRARLNTDREALQTLLGATPDLGIYSYFMHLFVGDWHVVNTATGKTLLASGEAGFQGTYREALAFAQKALKEHPDLNVLIEPNKFTWQQDAATELSSKAYWAFMERARQALNLSRDEITELTRGLTRPKGGKKFFGHVEAREANLAGFFDDPVEAAAIYSHGLARKLAFHDFEQQALRTLEQFNTKATTPGLHDALTEYVARVMGRPGSFERGWNAVVEWAFGPKGVLKSVPGGQRLRIRRTAATIRKMESMFRLGYSPLSAFVNLSQTAVNTASKIGYHDTLAATKLLAEARLGRASAAEVDDLLRQMSVEYAVPLSSPGATAFKDAHKLAWWHPLYLFNKAETVNRSIAALAGYQRAVRSGLPKEEALIAGRQLSDEMNFVYSVEGLPALLASPQGQVLGQFKPFLINELQFIAGLRGAEIPRFMLNLTAAGGVGALMSLPFINIGDVLAGEVFGERPSEFVKRKAPRVGRGVLGMLGFDAEQSVAINSIMAGRTFAGERNALMEMVDLSLGPAASDAVALSRGILGATQFGAQVAAEKIADVPRRAPGLSREDRVRISRQLMPVMARRMWDAYRIQQTGTVIQPTTGREVFSPESPTKEAVATVLGFRTIERAERQREVFTAQRIGRQLAERRTEMVKEIVAALRSGNRERARELRREARRRGIVITNDVILNALKNANKTTLERTLESLPKFQRREIGRQVESRLPTLSR